MKSSLAYLQLGKTSAGFTLVELLIASAVFSTVLLLSLTGFLQIGQLFYKGVSATNTQNVARNVMDSIKGDVSFSSTAVGTIQNANAGSTPRQYFCASGSRYAFIRGKALNSLNESNEMKKSGAFWQTSPNSWTNFGLLKDSITGGCSNPFTGSGQYSTANPPQELLADNMRVSNLAVNQVSASDPTLINLYNLDVEIAYGDDAALTVTSGTPPTASCKDVRSTSSYCFVTSLHTTVRRGF